MTNDKITTIRVHKSTRDKIVSLGNYDDTVEDILKMLLQNYDENIIE